MKVNKSESILAENNVRKCLKMWIKCLKKKKQRKKECF